MLHLTVPGGQNKILLHSCCAPCSGAVVECLLQNGLKPVVFFSNSNIVPREEYELRLAELRRYCDALGVSVVEDEYDHEAWLDYVVRHSPDGRSPEESATAPERGSRCLNCFKFRLLRAARFASANDFPVLATTLASSRWKSLEQVDAAGRWACCSLNQEESVPGRASEGETCYENGLKRARSYQENDDLTQKARPQVVWWPQNWRKGGLQPRRAEIIKEQNFYNQNYCGCEFSKR